MYWLFTSRSVVFAVYLCNRALIDNFKLITCTVKQ
jgi:hypothetical protein